MKHEYGYVNQTKKHNKMNFLINQEEEMGNL